MFVAASEVKPWRFYQKFEILIMVVDANSGFRLLVLYTAGVRLVAQHAYDIVRHHFLPVAAYCVQASSTQYVIDS